MAGNLAASLRALDVLGVKLFPRGLAVYEAQATVELNCCAAEKVL